MVPDRKTYEAAVELIEDVCGDLQKQGAGIMFALELSAVNGLSIQSD